MDPAHQSFDILTTPLNWSLQAYRSIGHQHSKPHSSIRIWLWLHEICSQNHLTWPWTLHTRVIDILGTHLHWRLPAYRPACHQNSRSNGSIYTWHISCNCSHIWMEPCGLLCWWHDGHYAGRLQCIGVPKISISLVYRVHRHKPHFWCFHVTIAIDHVVYYIGSMLAYMQVDFSVKGCPKYPWQWCAGYIATPHTQF